MSQDVVQIKHLDNVFVQIYAKPGIIAELAEHFTFYVPGAHYTPKFRNKMWDGKIRLLNRKNNTIYAGLAQNIRKFCEENDYEFQELNRESNKKISAEQLREFYAQLNLPFKPRDYQKLAFLHGAVFRKNLIVSPTASGKSLIIYLLVRWFMRSHDTSALIVVPSTSLVEQLYTDFKNYSKNEKDFHVEEHFHRLYSGFDKHTNKQVTISTWQSLYKMPLEYFRKFEFVLVDECHQAQANSLKEILIKCVHARYRFGTTGTLQDTKCHELVITGLTGPKFQATTTKKLMEEKTLAELKIKCVILKYGDEDKKACKKLNHPEEVEYLVKHPKRSKFIEQLALSLSGNTLILFRLVQKHGLHIYADIEKALAKNENDRKRRVFFIAGKTKTEEREAIRSIVEKETDAIIVASVGVFGTGVNIQNLENIIFSSPIKSKIRTLQSIGRGLRKGRTSKATLYDIVDDLSWKKRKNFSLKHFIERMQIYDKEKFEYTIHTIPIK